MQECCCCYLLMMLLSMIVVVMVMVFAAAASCCLLLLPPAAMRAGGGGRGGGEGRCYGTHRNTFLDNSAKNNPIKMTKAYIIVGGVRGADLEKRAEGVLVQQRHLRKFVKIGKKPSFSFDLLEGWPLLALLQELLRIGFRFVE